MTLRAGTVGGGLLGSGVVVVQKHDQLLPVGPLIQRDKDPGCLFTTFTNPFCPIPPLSEHHAGFRSVV